ncbi:hypothetical protein PILCRDRAFT_351717 [Piloderma croceum F 1598]|uniref:Uncharacterized protein n=1 Tax=Piloderma croceum (strain F 1598) TaxID=765440 RepID=A0A0C3C6B1_PILCF|nr:hypothetical protein PILCRDRAFT_351717 [Piloderma croceum F 1598]
MASAGVLNPRPTSLYHRFSLVATFLPTAPHHSDLSLIILGDIHEETHPWLWYFERGAASGKPSRPIWKMGRIRRAEIRSSSDTGKFCSEVADDQLYNRFARSSCPF